MLLFSGALLAFADIWLKCSRNCSVVVYIPQAVFAIHFHFIFIFLFYCHICFASSYFIFFCLFLSCHNQRAARWPWPFKFLTFPLGCFEEKNLKHDTLSLRRQYLHNIKQIASGNVFQCLSTPHGVAGGLASTSRGAAKTRVYGEGSGCAW